MKKDNNLDEYLETFGRFVEDHPYDGTAKQIVTLALGIAEASKKLDKSIFLLYKEQSSISSKIFSKLKVIGETISEMDKTKRKDVIKGLPPSYSTIHVLCSLKPEELVTAVKSKCVTKTMSVRKAREYTKQVRFPQLAATDGEIGRWGRKQEHLWSVFRPDDVPLEGEAKETLEEALRRVCKEHGVQLRQARITATTALREDERRERAAFWRKILEKEITQKWFQDAPEPSLKKQFNIKTVDELRDTPLRQFTGFLINADLGREKFWKIHGQAYVAKLQFLMESTEDAGQRFNYKRRLETVMGERTELAIWNNVMMKNSGFI